MRADRSVSGSDLSNHAGLLQLGGHVAVLAATSAEIVVAPPQWWLVWWLVLPLHGAVLVFLFAPLHESVHLTAFRSRRLNWVVATVCGFLLLLPPRWFRRFHLAHHRFTQDPARDPELSTAKPDSWPRYLLHVSGLPVWWGLIRALAVNAAVGPRDSFVPDRERGAVRGEAMLFVGGYAAVAVASVLAGSMLAVWLWVVPAVLGQPWLRLFLLAEHAGCPQTPDMRQNTRTTLTNAAVRALTWNMSFHTEHHAHPGVPFHGLPALHRRMAGELRHCAPGYRAVHRSLVKSFRAHTT